MNLSGKTILVTGGAGYGVGAGVCEAVIQAGGRLILNDLRPAETEQATQRFGGAIPLPGDVSDEADVNRMFAELDAQGITLDGLVNNAGVGLTGLPWEITSEQFDRLTRVDLLAVWMMTKAFVLHYQQAGKISGSVVNVSSVHAFQTMNRYTVYAAAKAGVEGMTRGLAVDLGPLNIRCNAIAPGHVHSEQGTELIRTWTDDPAGWEQGIYDNYQTINAPVEAIDCGWAAVYFLADISRRVTGQILRVDGGMTALLLGRDFS